MFTLTLAAMNSLSISSGQTTFAEWKISHGKSYKTLAEEARRAAIFAAHVVDIETHNAINGQTWRKALNQFSDQTVEEFRGSHGWVSPRGLGHLDDTATTRGGLVVHDGLELPANFKLSDLPKTIDWRTKGKVSPIKNQGMCGSCWAFGSTENIESHVAISENMSAAPVLSPQNLVSCDPNPKHCGGKGGCAGSIPELAFDYVEMHGIASEKDWPYLSGHTSIDEACNNTAKPAAFVTGYTKLTPNNYRCIGDRTHATYHSSCRGPPNAPPPPPPPTHTHIAK